MLGAGATPTFGNADVDVSFKFAPACEFSPITSTQQYPPFTVTSGQTLDFVLNAASYTYTYKDEWAAKGYSDGCTIGFRLSGYIAPWASVTGETVTIAPI